jgi:hypothetical protein
LEEAQDGEEDVVSSKVAERHGKGMSCFYFVSSVQLCSVVDVRRFVRQLCSCDAEADGSDDDVEESQVG